MIQGIHYNPFTIRQATVCPLPVPGTDLQFPLLQLDIDSYIVGAEIQSGINFNYAEGVHCIQIGKYSALAEKITFLINLNHDYKSVFQGSPSFISESRPSKLKRKGSVLIQNDVWVGHGVTLLSGITIHNGAIIGAESVVTKDVPSYAIVAGNPAKIIGYRFPEEERAALNEIAWWNWDQTRLLERKEELFQPVEQFIDKFQKEAKEAWDQVVPAYEKDTRKNLLFIMDATEPFPVWQKVVKEYLSLKETGEESRLILYLSTPSVEQGHKDMLLDALKDYKGLGDDIIILDSLPSEDVRGLFATADYFITTRQEKNLLWTEYADHYGVKLLYGTDIPVFSL
jgi:virginiamycin A acetyltransferase